MLTVAEALEAVLARVRPLPTVTVPLAEALGLVLAEPVAADRDSPPFDKALMDGYAVRAADLSAGPTRLRVVEEVTAGTTPIHTLGPGEATAIMTGAPLPDGADAVVMVERSRRDGDFVVLDEPGGVAPGRNRLTRGREMRRGEVILAPGDRLHAARLGLLAAVGRTEVRVTRRPVVAIVSTGDELVEPGSEPGPGQIRNSNATILRGLVEASHCVPRVLPIARDDSRKLGTALESGLNCDALVITGGVSAGTHDLVPESLAALGVERAFHKVRLKPGKPLWFGVGPAREGASPLVFGLPGNPVSGIVGFLLFVRPALEGLAGLPLGPGRTVAARLAVPHRLGGDRPTYHPARLRPGLEPGSLPEAEPLDWAGSADLRAVANADGFVALPAGEGSLPAGEMVRFLPLG